MTYSDDIERPGYSGNFISEGCISKFWWRHRERFFWKRVVTRGRRRGWREERAKEEEDMQGQRTRRDCRVESGVLALQRKAEPEETAP